MTPLDHLHFFFMFMVYVFDFLLVYLWCISTCFIDKYSTIRYFLCIFIMSSNEKVICCLCEATVIKKNLKTHYTRRHPNKDLKWKSATSNDVRNFFPVISSKKKGKTAKKTKSKAFYKLQMLEINVPDWKVLLKKAMWIAVKEMKVHQQAFRHFYRLSKV